jgi:hypothetical protein
MGRTPGDVPALAALEARPRRRIGGSLTDHRNLLGKPRPQLPFEYVVDVDIAFHERTLPEIGDTEAHGAPGRPVSRAHHREPALDRFQRVAGHGATGADAQDANLTMTGSILDRQSAGTDEADADVVDG